MERRLAAILAADIVGFSRLMGKDETGTHRRVKDLFEKLLQPALTTKGGRVVKVMGDGLLAEFASVVNAVDSAMSIQEAMHADSADEGADRRLKLRIGINLGDIIFDGDDIYGDGVNVAARLEALAPPNGIAVSSIVKESLGRQDNRGFVYGGEHAVKNIDHPLAVWLWSPNADFSLAPRPTPSRRSSRKLTLAISGIECLSQDAELGDLSVGLCRDLETELGRFTQFDLIPSQANRVDVSGPADYVLSGSVRSSGARIRVSVQVTEGGSGTQMWSQRYDGQMEDLFEFQDEVVQKVCGHLHQPLMRHAATRARTRGGGGAEIYDHYLKAFHHIEHPTRAGLVEARNACMKVLEADPGFVLAYEHLAWISLHSAFNGWIEDPGEALREARRDAVRGIALDNKEAYLRSAHGLAEVMLGNGEQGLREARLAVELNPNDPEHVTFLAASLTQAGQLDEAFAVFERAEGLSPGYPPIHLFQGVALFAASRLEQAVDALGQLLLVLPEYNYALAFLAASQAELGNRTAAEEAVAAIERQSEHMTQAYLEALLGRSGVGVLRRLIPALDTCGLPKS